MKNHGKIKHLILHFKSNIQIIILLVAFLAFPSTLFAEDCSKSKTMGDAIKCLQKTIVPKGAIIIWSGNTKDIPQGWVLCDGNNGTPDLRDRFVIGAVKQSDVGKVGKPVGNSGGNSEHSHEAGTYSEAGHKHDTGFTVKIGDNHKTHIGGTYPRDAWFGNKGFHVPTENDGPYETKESKQMSISGTSGKTSSLPPYFALAYIMKL